MQKERQKILLVTRNFPPLTGGMERLMHYAYKELSREFHLSLVGPHGCEEFLSDGDFVLTCPTVPASSFILSCQWQAYHAARKLRPQLVIAGSGVTAPAALWAGRRVGARVACFLHGLDLLVRNIIYQRVFLSTIRRCDAALVNSRYTATLARDIGVSSEKVHLMHPAVAFQEVEHNSGKDELRKLIGINEKTVVLLSVGRLTRRKGIVEFIEKVMPKLVRKYHDLKLLIVGEEPKQALNAAAAVGIKRNILTAVEKNGLVGHVVMLGRVDQEALSKAYLLSDVHIFPVLDLPDDVEGFGMVAIEAAAHGLPTIAFGVGGVSDAIAHGVSGYVIASGNYPAFFEAIETCIDRDDKRTWRAQCRSFARGFSLEQFGERLRGVCRGLMRL